MDYKKMKLQDVIEWCKANNQIEWLKEVVNRDVEVEVYPEIEVDGKKVINKSATPTIEMRPISFIQVKTEFAKKFMPEILPKKTSKKTATMRDIVNAL